MQTSLFAQIDLLANQDPRYALAFAVPNGQYRPGERMEPGLRAGVPDICLPVPRPATPTHPAYHGLFMELKVGSNPPSARQVRWLQRLSEQGYYACIVRDDIEQALTILQDYLNGATP